MSCRRNVAAKIKLEVAIAIYVSLLGSKSMIRLSTFTHCSHSRSKLRSWRAYCRRRRLCLWPCSTPTWCHKCRSSLSRLGWGRSGCRSRSLRRLSRSGSLRCLRWSRSLGKHRLLWCSALLFRTARYDT